MWFDFAFDEGRISCPACGSTGNGLVRGEGEGASYFCLTCLTSSAGAAPVAQSPSLLQGLTRLTRRKR